jgi:hypothetical protein
MALPAPAVAMSEVAEAERFERPCVSGEPCVLVANMGMYIRQQEGAEAGRQVQG